MLLAQIIQHKAAQNRGKSMELKDKTFLVVGTGISGISAVKLLAKKGAKIILFDSNSELEYDDIRRKLPEGLEFGLILGELPG